MAIYTRTGDDGTTALYGGTRKLKSDDQIEAYGSVDELTSTLGIFSTYIRNVKERSFIRSVQHDLYVIMCFLAESPTDLSQLERQIPIFEQKIDLFSEKLPPLRHFILPNGARTSCWAHTARAICRRAERTVVRFCFKHKLSTKKEVNIVLTYINRLSDLLFIYARFFNTQKEISLTK